MIKNPSKGTRGQDMKSPKEKLDEEIPEPSFLADNCHPVKVVAMNIFSVINEGSSQR